MIVVTPAEELKTMRIIYTLLFAALSAPLFAQSPPQENKIPFNKALYFMGTPEREYDDPYLYFNYTGIPELLLEEIAIAHGGSQLSYNPEIGCYELRFIHEPHWYYMSYRVRIKYQDDGTYRVWAQYEFDEDVNPHTPKFYDGYIMQDIAAMWISLYQGMLDRAMERTMNF